MERKILVNRFDIAFLFVITLIMGAALMKFVDLRNAPGPQLGDSICREVRGTLDSVFGALENDPTKGHFRVFGFEYDNGVTVDITIQKPLEYSFDME